MDYLSRLILTYTYFLQKDIARVYLPLNFSCIHCWDKEND